ncbi:DNA-directed RNA polymerase II subunit RPB7-like [Convolutriloba macropyga]|uniref:DNA-directed RNA polymerase II subunit RPB7-like n=1 Tax=Convolutriloba macropyga TaxID=536237 RepID=UPI003F5204FF
MFYLMTLEHEILLHPRYFGPKLLETVRKKLYSEVEGTCSGKYGFIVSVHNLTSIGSGYIQPGRGFVLYPVTYQAIVFRPFKGEVLEAVVTQVTKLGIFTEIGPMACFISKHGIPSDMEFVSDDKKPRYKSKDETDIIDLGSTIRVKLMGTRIDANDIFAIGTLLDDYLGPV